MCLKWLPPNPRYRYFSSDCQSQVLAVSAAWEKDRLPAPTASSPDDGLSLSLAGGAVSSW